MNDHPVSITADIIGVPANRRNLECGDIDLWLTFFDEINDERLFGEYRALLSEQETQQECRFYFFRDRKRYLVTRALIRWVLSRYASTEPRAWNFSNNPYGRPEIVWNGRGDGSQDLVFNISHTNGLIAVGVTRARALGVDVENTRDRDVSTDLAEHFFGSTEVTDLRAMPGEKRQDRFWEYWTFKESYIKARGMGLFIPLDKVCFRYPDDRRVEIEISQDLNDRADRWQFWQIRPSDRYLLAVCAERSHDRWRVPSLIRTVPLRHETVLAAEFLRTSE